LDEFRGTQQAADLVGPEGWFHGLPRRSGLRPLRVTRPCSSRPSTCSQYSAVSSNRPRSTPVSTSSDSNRLTRSSVQTLPVCPPPYFTFAGWPPTPPNEASKNLTPDSYAAT